MAIAELGIGLNPTVTLRGHAMLDEKAARTAHVAIGRNTGAYGGDNEASIHVDMIFSPELEADGRPVRCREHTAAWQSEQSERPYEPSGYEPRAYEPPADRTASRSRSAATG